MERIRIHSVIKDISLGILSYDKENDEFLFEFEKEPEVPYIMGGDLIQKERGQIFRKKVMFNIFRFKEGYGTSKFAKSLDVDINSNSGQWKMLEEYLKDCSESNGFKYEILS